MLLLATILTAEFALVSPIAGYGATKHKWPFPMYKVTQNHKCDVVFTGSSGKQYHANTDAAVPYEEFDYD